MLHLADCSDGRLFRLFEQPMLRPMLSVTDCLPNKPNVNVAQLRPLVTKMVIGSINWHRVIELCLLFIILPIENCTPMTRNALSIEAVGRRANNVLLNYYHIQSRPETMIVIPTR